MVSESSITGFVLLVKDEIDEIKSGQEGWGKFDVINNGKLWVILGVDWIGSSQDSCSCIQRADDS